MNAREAYASGTDAQFSVPEVTLGPWTSHSLRTDPKHLCFTLARYKFVAKLLEGRASVLEVGSGDGFGLPILAQSVKRVVTVDWDERLVEGNRRRLRFLDNVLHVHADLNKTAMMIKVDAAVTVDVIEHLEPASEDRFMRAIVRCLHHDGVLITGTPNITAAAHQSPQSAAQHINLKSAASLREMTARYCRNVFMFGQNDEVVHTGYAPMCHYLWSLGVGIRPEYV